MDGLVKKKMVADVLCIWMLYFFQGVQPPLNINSSLCIFTYGIYYGIRFPQSLTPATIREIAL